MKKPRFLLIGYNFYPEPTGIGKYSGEMVLWLSKRGYDCTVITTFPYYPYWKVQEPYNKNKFWYKTEKQAFESGGKLTVHRCPIYVPSKPSGLKRILLDMSFLLTAFLKLFQILFANKFDVVFTVAPSFQLGLLGALYKKICKSKLYYHIQDMQIEAARDLKMIKSERIIKTLLRVEKYIFYQTDVISSISEGMVTKIKEKAKKDVFLFPNWTDTALFFPIADRAELKMNFGFEASDMIILYSGAIGEKQGLEAILYSAKHFENMERWKFMICGSGPYTGKLKALAEDLKLQNIFFFPLQPIEKFNQFLNLADVHLVVQRASASDLVMPSKLTTILAVGGLALVTANKGTGLHALVNRYNIGVLVDAESQDELNKGISKALLSEERINIRANARAYAEKFLSIDSIMNTFEMSVYHNSYNTLSQKTI